MDACILAAAKSNAAYERALRLVRLLWLSGRLTGDQARELDEASGVVRSTSYDRGMTDARTPSGEVRAA